MRGEDRLGCRIDLAEGGVRGVEGDGGGGLRSDAGSDADGGGAGSVNRGPQASADASEEGSAVGRAFLGFDDFDGVAVDVGLDLPPERRARASAAQAYAGDGDVHFAEKSK